MEEQKYEVEIKKFNVLLLTILLKLHVQYYSFSSKGIAYL